MLGDAGNDCWVSSASVWKIAIKSALRKFRGDFSLDQLEQGIDEGGLLPLDVTMRYAAAIAKVAVPHGDPFDRLLVAQCEVEALRLLTADEVLARLPVAIKA